ncbi:MAG: hypothetical protein RLP44_16750 [Aggregatilineales bacterium]
MRIPTFVRSGLIIALVFLFLCASPVLATPLPTVTLNVPANPSLGEAFTFVATFDNTGTTTGYGPFIDLVLPATGVDGDDGITFIDATYLGIAVESSRSVIPASGCVNHPFLVDSTNTPLQVCGTPGDELIVLTLPFGSYTPDQPPLAIDVNAQININADVNAPLNIYGRGGFQFGIDPLNNPCCDAPIVTPVTPNSGGWGGAPATPVILRPSKNYLGTADETEAGFIDNPNEAVTGPNGSGGATPIQYEIVVDVANAQQITNVNITDLLPAGMLFDQIISVVPAGSTPGVGAILPNNTNLSITWAAPITGTAATDEIRIVIQVFMDNVTTNGVPQSITNQFDVDANWQPIDPRDALADVGTAGAANAPLVLARALAMQKSSTVVGGGPRAPGSTIRYTLAFQVSDYFAFDNVTIADTLSDGMTFVLGSAFITVNGGGVAVNNVGIVPALTNNPDGSTLLNFDVSGAIGAPLIGGCIDPVAGTANPTCAGFNANALTLGTITFDILIEEVFTLVTAGATINIDQGDLFRNGATVDADALNTQTFAPLGFQVSDNALETFQLDRGLPAKFIFAVNNVLCPACANQVEAGDIVTYRIRYDSPTSDFEDLVLTDYLPSPIFDVSDPDADNVAGPAFNSPPIPAPAINTPPPAGAIWYSQNDTFNALFPAVTPIVAINAASNSLSVTYGDHADPLNQASVIDLLFSVVATSDPFASGLTLANHISASEGSTNAGPDRGDAVAALNATQPLLVMRKGAVSTDNVNAVFIPPNPSPVPFNPPGTGGLPWTGTISSDALDNIDINSDLEGLNPGDTVTFAIVIENLGNGAAFDVVINDVLPPGFVIPPGGLNLNITNGAGVPVGFIGNPGDLFSGGLELVDPGTGVCQQFNPNSGANVIVLTYELTIDGTVAIPSALQNTANLTQFAAQDGFAAFANNIAGGTLSDSAAAIVGFLADLNNGGTSGADFLAQLGVSELPATGDSPLSQWRLPLFMLLGILLSVVFQTLFRMRHKAMRFIIYALR